MLVRRRHDLVAGLEPEPTEHDRAALARRGRQRHLIGRRTDQAGELLPDLGPEPDRLLEVRHARPPLGQIAGDAACHGVGDRPRQRPERSRVEVRDPLEHGKQGAALLERHAGTSRTESTGA